MKVWLLAGVGFTLLGAAPAGNIGNWKITDTTDAITDARKVKASVYSDDKSAILSVVCWGKPRESDIAFLLTTEEFLGSSETTRGRGRREAFFRIDQNPAETLQIYYSDSTAANFQTDDVAAMEAILRQGNRLLARLVTYRFNQVDKSFEVDGAGDAINYVRQACG